MSGSTDRRLRELERAAAEGDAEARLRLYRQRVRLGAGGDPAPRGATAGDRRMSFPEDWYPGGVGRQREHSENWGGAREGAGRPQRNAIVAKVGLDAEELEIVDAYQELHELSSRAEAFRRAVRVHMAPSVRRAE